MKRLFKYFLYPIEFLLFAIIMVLGFILPFSWGSRLGEILLGSLGPFMPVTRVARQNLGIAFPTLSEQEKKVIIKGMWQNLGRTFLEYFRLSYQSVLGADSPYEVHGMEHLEALIQDDKPGLLFTAHYGNWEIGTVIAHKKGLDLAQITRFLNNPLVRWIVNAVQGLVAKEIIPKGSTGAKDIVRVLRRGGHISMLADQKMNDGVPIPFFGKDAMTAPALAKLALKFDCPIVPFQVIRLKGIRCKVVYYPPLQIPQTGTAQEKTENILKQMNHHIEEWIRAHPEQWFWVHRRWPKEIYERG